MVVAQLAEFFADLSWEALPRDVVDKVQRHVLDTIFVGMAGASSPVGVSARATAARTDNGGPCTVFHEQRRFGPLAAAFANGVCSHALQFDDGNRLGLGHPGTVTVPAAFAAAELMDRSWGDTVVAVAAGYEVFARLGWSMNPSHFLKGFNPTGTVGTVAAAAAAGRLLGLNSAEMGNALGLAGSVAGGLMEFARTGTESTYFTTGIAAQEGLLAAIMAQQGITGPLSIVEGEKGLHRAMADGADPQRIVKGLGSEFLLLASYLKPYPTCRHTHGAIETAQRLAAQRSFRADTIDRIEVRTYRLAAEEGDIPHPTSLTGLENSLHCTVAITLLYGTFGLRQRDLSLLEDPRVRELAAKTTVVVDPAMEALHPERGTQVVVYLSNGECLTETSLAAKGEPKNPLSDDELIDKWTECTRPLQGRDQVEALVHEVIALEPEAPIGRLWELFGRLSR